MAGADPPRRHRRGSDPWAGRDASSGDDVGGLASADPEQPRHGGQPERAGEEADGDGRLRGGRRGPSGFCSAGPRAELGLFLAAATGAREAELVALAWGDLDGKRLRIGRQRHSVGGTLVRDRTKTGGARTVVLDQSTLDAHRPLARRGLGLTGGEPGRWMLAQPGAADPPSPRWLYDVFRKAAKDAGVLAGREAGFVLHDLRHWAGSVALRDGHDPVTVAARLGHSPDTLLRVYAQEIADGQDDLAKSMAARIAKMAKGKDE